MGPNVGSIRRALPFCAMLLTILVLFAVPYPAQANISPATTQCGPSTPFGVLCAIVALTSPATAPFTATITSLFTNPGTIVTTPPNIEASLSLTTSFGGFGSAYVTFAGEASGIIGADVSVPRAYWLTQGIWCWPNCAAANGALAIFNTIGSPPIGFANVLIIGDPPPSIPLTEIDDLVSGLGGPSSLPFMGDLTPDSMGDITPPSLSSGGQAPEPSYIAVLLGAGMVLFLWRRRRARQTAGGA